MSGGNARELKAALRKASPIVPRRGFGRTKDHTEPWIMAHLLGTLADARQLEYPIRISRRDAPDYCITCNETRIGLEITEAISKHYAHYAAIAARDYPCASMEPSLFRFGMNLPSTPVLRNRLASGTTRSPGWTGEEPETEWALYIRRAIAVKVKKLASPTFDVYPENWLAIYANLPLFAVQIEAAAAKLEPQLSDIWSRRPSFQQVFAQEGETIVKFEPGGYEVLRLSRIEGSVG